MLRHAVADILFTKVNGEKRQLLGTLNRLLIPDEHLKFKGNVNDPDFISDSSIELPKNIRVFDVQKMGWRTIVIENLINFKVANEGLSE